MSTARVELPASASNGLGRSRHMRTSGRVPLCLCFCFLCVLAGCGGGGGSSNTPAPAPTILSVKVSCSLTIVPTSQADDCSATVNGTGTFDSTVNWLVNNIAGGNTTVGTISTGGVYTAPSAVPTPYLVSITATSSVDASKSGSMQILVAGTIASISQSIPATTGGTLMLPDGSNATIPPNFLTADQSVTLDELSALPQQPPNPLIVGAGTTLRLTFSTPILANLSRYADQNPDLTFTANEQPGSLGLGGAVGLLGVTDANGNLTFLPTGFILNEQSASLPLPTSWLTPIQSGVASISASGANTSYQAFPENNPSPMNFPIQLCWQAPNWVNFSTCSAQVSGKKVLLVVHGMMSCVEETYGSLINYQQLTSNYDVIVGFDYDWTQHLTDNGTLLASFLNNLLALGPSKVDIIAHSEGVPVSLYGASQVTDGNMRAKIKNFTSLAGPILGTPLTTDWYAELFIYTYYRGRITSCPSSSTFQNYTFNQFLEQPFVHDLDKNSGTLLNTIVPAAKQQLTGTNITVLGGTAEGPFWLLYQIDNPFGNTPNDGIVGLDSALAFSTGLQVYPLPPFSLWHIDLPIDTNQSGVLYDDSFQVSNNPPQLSCLAQGQNCEGPQDSLFTFLGTGFGNNENSIQVFRQDSTGNYSQLSPVIQDNNGDIVWSVVPTCTDPAGQFSILTFDTSEHLAANGVMQTVDAGTCANPVPSITSLVPPSLTVNSPPQTLTISGTGFLTTSAVTYGGVPHAAQYVSGSHLSIQLSAADLANAGYFPVVVTNPPPGGGASNTVNFVVGNPVPAITSLSPPSLPVDSPPQPLVIDGTGFVSSSTVTYNGASRNTTFVSSSELTIELTSADLSVAGSYPVFVTNPAPLGGQSNVVQFVVSGQGQPTPGAWSGVAALNSAFYVVGGGQCQPGGCDASFGQGEMDTVEDFNVATQTWNSAAPLQYSRFGLAASAIGENIFALGGTAGQSSIPVPWVEQYSPNLNTWSVVTQMPTPRWKLTSAVVNQTIYAIGGGASGNQCQPSSVVEAYTASTNSWATKSSMPTARWGLGSAVINNKVYTVGGALGCPGGSASAAVESYDPGTDSWSILASMPTARWDMGVAAANGKLYAIGGWDSGTQSVLDTVEEFDPATNSWQPRASMPTARTGLVAVTINGLIYAYGGSDGTTVLSTLEIFDPATNTWSSSSEVIVSPSTVTVPEAGLQTFSATVSIGGGITWSVEEGSSGGTITSTGIYTPPNNTGVFHVIATSTQDPSQYAVATVTVIPALNYTVIYSFRTNSGYFPQAGVIQLSDTSLWGTTTYGGAYQGECSTIGCGTVYELDSEHNFALIHAFAGTDGAFPEAPLLQTSDGNLFGTTLGGGTNGISWACAVGPVQGCGTIFEIDTDGSFRLSVYFHGDQLAGTLPQAGLLQSQDGYLYGTTTGGGCPFQGAVFRSDSLGNIMNVHCFTGEQGADSTASLIQDSDGFFYTTTTGSGVNSGTIVKLNSAGDLTVLHTFSGVDGATPTAALIQGADGFLYGTTAAGGTGNSGTIFRIGYDGTFASLHAFSGPDGAGTLGYYTYISALIESNDGFFYGTTLAGGASNVGTIFRMDSAGNVTVLHSFNGTDGSGPLAGVIQGTDGYLYGTTSGGGSGGGVVYQIAIPGNQRRH